MPSSEARRDIFRAKALAWWDRYDAVFLVVGILTCGVVVGGYAMSFYDREERMTLMRRHDDDTRDLRMQCRARVDERDLKVQEAVGAATTAARAVAQLAENAATEDDPKTPRVPPVVIQKPVVKRSPPVNMEEAVTRANAQIKEGRR